jgi:hypothetical protein
MAKYGKKSQEKVKKVMEEMKKGKLKSGGSGKKVKNRKQAIAIGLSEARKTGAKVPPKRGSKVTKGQRKPIAKKGTAKRKKVGSKSKK